MTTAYHPDGQFKSVTGGERFDCLARILERWWKKATQAGGIIKRVTVAYEAGRDACWLAPWPHDIEVRTIHPSSVPVSRQAQAVHPGRKKLPAGNEEARSSDN